MLEALRVAESSQELLLQELMSSTSPCGPEVNYTAARQETEAIVAERFIQYQSYLRNRTANNLELPKMPRRCYE
jgi:hypothetical protein